MPTRLRRPSKTKKLAITMVLVCFQAYLGYSVVSGQYGIISHEQLKMDISALEAESVKLQAEIDSYNMKISLFDPKRLDPDILSERARALLSMAHKDDRIVLLSRESNEL